jgi:hypothetical protein
MLDKVAAPRHRARHQLVDLRGTVGAREVADLLAVVDLEAGDGVHVLAGDVERDNRPLFFVQLRLILSRPLAARDEVVEVARLIAPVLPVGLGLLESLGELALNALTLFGIEGAVVGFLVRRVRAG